MATTVTPADPVTADPPSRRARGEGWALTLVWISVLAALAVVVWPTTLGGRTSVTIVSGSSMEPTYHTGDLALVRKVDDLAVGDVIVYTVPAGEPGEGRNVIHRVIGGSAAEGWRTQGDNRETPDIWRPRPEDVVGTVRAIVPEGGTWVLRAISPAGLGLVVALLAMWVLWPRRRSDEGPEHDANG